ncbi:MAG: hypothetical protein NVV63_16055 [Opitutus sp.]|nr:hypothetical protein [Opitutus sp.]
MQDAAVAARGVHESAAFGDREAEWLFAVNVLARDHRRMRERHVPVVGSADEYDIDVGTRQQLLVILVNFHAAITTGGSLIAIGALDTLLHCASLGQRDVAHGHDTAIVTADERMVVAACNQSGADDGDIKPVARRFAGLGANNLRAGKRGGKQGSGFQEVATRQTGMTHKGVQRGNEEIAAGRVGRLAN